MKQRLIQRICVVLAAILWTAAVTTMVGALDGEPQQMAEAALLIALAACVPTGHLVVEYSLSRSREAMAKEVDAIAERHRQLLVDTVLEVVGRADAARSVARIGPPS